MTRAEVNAIKARMLDDVLLEIRNATDDAEVLSILDTKKYVLSFIEEVMTEQAEMAKQAGY